MKRRNVILSLFFVVALTLQAQQPSKEAGTKPTRWDLKSCIEYAKTNNIEVQQAKITTESSIQTLQQSKNDLLPSLSASAGMSYTNGKVLTNGILLSSASKGSTYSLSTSMTLFDGMKNYNTIRQSKLEAQAAGLQEKVTENEIVVSITEAYLSMLYAHENLVTAERTVETSKAQVALSQNLLTAGSIAKADFSQVQSQYASDRYTLVTTQNTYETCKLELKQLLELDMTDTFEVVIPELAEKDILKLLPSKTDVYQTALSVMPEIQSSSISVNVAEYDLKSAKSGYYPSLSLDGSLSSNHDGGLSTDFGTQLNNNFSQYVGLSLSIPIYDKGSTKTSVQKAKLSIQSAKLDYTSAQKTLLKTVESLYQDAVASQGKYTAAIEQLKAAEESYNLVKEQFGLGMKNTVELLSAQDSYLEAEQTLSQAKFGAVLSQKLLNFYQNIPIEL
jgi:outer membrane protein